jgi:hypothetical protein
MASAIKQNQVKERPAALPSIAPLLFNGAPSTTGGRRAVCAGCSLQLPAHPLRLRSAQRAAMANRTPNSSLTERQQRLDGFLNAALLTEHQRQLDDFLTAALDRLNDMDRVANEHLAAKKPWWHRLMRSGRGPA